LKYFKLVLLILAINLTGCATFSGDMLPQVEEFPITNEKPSINISLSFQQYLNGATVNQFTNQTEIDLMERTIKRFNKSGMYSSVSNTNSEADISVNFDVTDEGTASIGMAFLTGLTLYVIPSSATDLFKVTAKVTNNKTLGEGVIQVEDSITMWQQLFLLPLLPFNLLPVVSGDVQDNIIDTLAIKVHELALSKNLIIPSTPIKNIDTDTIDRMTMLKNAFDKGLISIEEYNNKKQELLNSL